MEIKTGFILFFLLPISWTTFSQTDSARSEKKIQYTNSFLSGGLFGEKGMGNSLTFSTIHGIRFGRWMAGAGLGYDTYSEWNVIPLIGSMSFDFDKIKGNAFYVQFNAGYTKSWQQEPGDGAVRYEEDGGYMINPSVGYRIRVEKYSLYISAGYKFQRINYSYTQPYWWWWGGDSPTPSSTSYVQQDMNRISIQIGFGLH